MKRKIIKLGQATYVASLPNKWIREQNLTKGDYLEFEERDGDLIISTEKKVGEIKRITIKLPSKKLFLKRLVYVPYRFGYDEIKFIFSDPSLIKDIQKAAEILMGFEIVEQSKDYCIFRSISSSFEEEYENLYRRMFLVIHNLMKESIDILRSKSPEKMVSLAGTEVTIDKLCCFCERVINKRGSKNFFNNSYFYITAWSLRQIGSDWYKDIILNLKNDISSDFISSLQKVSDYFEKYSACFYKPNLEEIFQLKEIYFDINDHLIKQLNSKNNNENNNERILIFHLLKILDKINHLVLSIQLPSTSL